MTATPTATPPSEPRLPNELTYHITQLAVTDLLAGFNPHSPSQSHLSISKLADSRRALYNIARADKTCHKQITEPVNALKMNTDGLIKAINKRLENYYNHEYGTDAEGIGIARVDSEEDSEDSDREPESEPLRRARHAAEKPTMGEGGQEVRKRAKEVLEVLMKLKL